MRFPFWAADNGCFNATWSEDHWLRWLDRLPRERCLFATAPDVYPDARATLDRSVHYFGLIREMGFPPALVAQDGAERLDLPWDEFDCLFIGGEKRMPSRLEWKLSAAAEGLAGAYPTFCCVIRPKPRSISVSSIVSFVLPVR